MVRSRVALLPTLLLLAAGCGGEGDDGLTLELAAQNGSGQAGSATFTPAGDGETTVALELSNPPAEAQPAHVHAGSCADIGEVLVPLESLVEGKSETTVAVSLDELETGSQIVHAHKSEAEFDVSVACADIPEAGAD